MKCGSQKATGTTILQKYMKVERGGRGSKYKGAREVVNRQGNGTGEVRVKGKKRTEKKMVLGRK
jgi:hypothetical protein